MAPIKFEEHIREKLDSREISPSAGSWDKLSEQLDEKESSGKNNKWWISSIAAIFVLALCGIIYLNMNRSVENTIVNTPEIQKPSENAIDEFESPVRLAEQEKTEESQAQPESKPKYVQKTASEDIRTTSNKKEQIALVEVEEMINREPIKTAKPASLQELKISEEMNKVLAEVSRLESQNGEVSDTEVEALLNKAIATIEYENVQKSSEISADALLADVEAEVYESFKEKVFEIVKTGYQKAAVAVSNKLDHSEEK
ncbi:hypothetical protein [uncultured Christiangramia sp.]|uniref:hypothetical protein n=1 Tax=Christiangramia sp. 3-2217-3z TaxID=3417564 RepID=UPI002636AAF6|nr:hypothetical protein [uncultured Christiangramia sp.]